DIVSQRTTDEKFHRKVVNALWVRVFIGLLGLNPSLRKDIAHRMSDCFETLASADLSPFQDVIKYEVAFVERIVRPGELDRAAAVTFYKVIELGRICSLCFDRCVGLIHGVTLLVWSRTSSCRLLAA